MMETDVAVYPLKFIVDLHALFLIAEFAEGAFDPRIATGTPPDCLDRGYAGGVISSIVSMLPSI